jgi:hypothetical protein
MANPDRGTAAPSKHRSPEQAWYVFKYLNPVSAADPKASFIAGFSRAYRDSISDQVDFAGLVPLLQRILNLLEDLAVERDVVRSLAIGEEENADADPTPHALER